METFVRGGSREAILDANTKIDRCLRAGAMAIGVELKINAIPGYLPWRNNRAIEQGVGPAMTDDRNIDIVRCNEPKAFLIIRKIEIAAGELATPPEAFITGLPRSPPQPDSIETAPTQRDQHIQEIAERGRMGWQKSSGYNLRARVEGSIDTNA